MGIIKNKAMKKLIPIIPVSIIVFLVVAYFIFNYTVEKITEREVKRITQGEIDKTTESEIDSLTKEITEKEIARITEERTKAITDQILGRGTTGETELKEVNCDNAPAQREFSESPYYTGPLIDNHLHMPFTFEVPPAIYEEADWDAPILEKEVFIGSIICGFDKTKINSAFGFYVVPNLLKGQAVQLIKQIEEQYKGRIVPFLMPTHISDLDLKPSDVEQILDSNEGLFKGFGEIALYKGSYKGVSPDDASLFELYKVADKHNLIVMVHPDNGQQQAIERTLKENPNVKFLFHGHEMEPYLMQILDKYDNAYYSVDASLYDSPSEHIIASLYGVKDKEEFISELKGNFNKILNTNLGIWKPRIEKHSDKFLWGTDRAFAWHFDAEVGAAVEEMSRSFIWQLDP